MDVLSQVASFGRPVKFSELVRKSPYPKATLYRFLQTLTNQQLLTYDATDQTYNLGVRLLHLAHTAWKNATIAPVARPHLRALMIEVGETIHLAQMDNGQVIFVDKYKAVDQFETLAQAGMVAPSYCTGVGKAMLAFLRPEERERALLQQAYLQYTPSTIKNAPSLAAELDEVRRSGVAYDREEHQRGIISIAAPILADSGTVLGAVSIATSVTRHSLDSLTTMRPSLLAAAEQIGVEAAVWQYPS